MNIVRLDFTHPGIAEFTVDYGGRNARIRLEGLETTGGPEETSIPWEPYYREQLKELFDAALREDTYWTDRSSE